MTQKKTLGIVAGLNRRAAMEVKTQLLALGDDDLSVVMTEDNFKIDPDPVFAVSDRKIFIFNDMVQLVFFCLLNKFGKFIIHITGRSQ